jgi:hypothetical protein
VRVGGIEIEVPDRHAIQPELLRRLPPRVASDDLAVLATGEDRRAEAEALDALGDLANRLAIVLPRVVLPWPQLADVHPHRCRFRSGSLARALSAIL